MNAPDADVQVHNSEWGRIVVLVDTAGGHIEIKDAASCPRRVLPLFEASLTLRKSNESDLPQWCLRATAESAQLSGGR